MKQTAPAPLQDERRDDRASSSQGSDRAEGRARPRAAIAMAQEGARLVRAIRLRPAFLLETAAEQSRKPDAPIEEMSPTQRAQSSGKAHIARQAATQRPFKLSLVLHETDGALDVVLGLPGASQDMRARARRAFDALAAEYGLHIADMIVNGALVERRDGGMGGRDGFGAD